MTALVLAERRRIASEIREASQRLTLAASDARGRAMEARVEAREAPSPEAEQAALTLASRHARDARLHSNASRPRIRVDRAARRA